MARNNNPRRVRGLYPRVALVSVTTFAACLMSLVPRLGRAVPLDLYGHLPTLEDMALSPDGSRIAFAGSRGGTAQIYTMAPDGSDAHALTQSADPATAPVYSPDGSRIAYVVVPGSGNARLHVMAADGTGDVTVTDGTDFSTFPSWSPDGRKLAFMAQHDGAWQVYIIGANGARLTPLTSGSGTNLFPVWTPDGP